MRGRRKRETGVVPHGIPVEGESPAGKSPEACDIAVSEMTGIPAERYCTWALVSWVHRPDGQRGHQMSLLSPLSRMSGARWDTLIALLETALADARHMAKLEGK